MNAPDSRGRGGVGSPRYRPTEHRWEVRIDLEPVGGRRKQKSFYGATKDAAVKATREYLHGLDGGQAPAPAALKVGRYLEDWLATVQVRPSTRGRYSGIVHNQLIPRLGATRLARLQPSDVKAMTDELQAKGSSPRTAAHCRRVLLTALNAAVGYEVVAHRVAHHSKAPPVPDPVPCRLTETQRQAILNACTEPWLSQLVAVALLTGLRQGEELALSVQDVDFEGSRLWVRHTLTRTDGAYVLGEPKSSTSRRPVTLNEAALDALRKAIASRHVECPIPDLIFTTARGQPRNGSVLTHRFQAALAAASLPTLRWHDLRAAHGSWLLDTGTDIYTVSRRLGHRDVATTARFYGVVSEDLQRQASDRLV